MPRRLCSASEHGGIGDFRTEPEAQRILGPCGGRIVPSFLMPFGALYENRYSPNEHRASPRLPSRMVASSASASMFSTLKLP